MCGSTFKSEEMQAVVHYKGRKDNIGIWRKLGRHLTLINGEDTFVSILAHVDS
jgi:hypothetical protein